MKTGKFTIEKIITILKENEAGAKEVEMSDVNCLGL